MPVKQFMALVGFSNMASSGEDSLDLCALDRQYGRYGRANSNQCFIVCKGDEFSVVCEEDPMDSLYNLESIPEDNIREMLALPIRPFACH